MSREYATQEEIQKLDVLGEGTFSIVFRCLYKEQEMVFKEFRTIDGIIERKHLERAARIELIAYRSLGDYVFFPKNLIEVKSDQNSEILGFLMEYIRGKTLVEKCKEDISLETKLKWINQLVQAVIYIEGKHYIHGDINGRNILIDENDNIKLIDFGSSTPIPLLGTPGFTAPELSKMNQYKTDAYSIGATMFLIFSGKNRFEGVNGLEISKMIEREREEERPETVLIQYAGLIKALLDYSPEKRPLLKNIPKLLKSIGYRQCVKK